MQNDLDPKGFEAALGCYSEGGCSGLDERERREVVTDIIEAYLSAVPDGEGELVRDLLSIEAIMEVIAKGERTLNPDFAVHVQTTITKARKALAASRLSQAGVGVTDEMVERVVDAVKPYRRETLFVDDLRAMIKAALSTKTTGGE